MKKEHRVSWSGLTLDRKEAKKKKREVKKAADKGTLLSLQTHPLSITAPKPAFNQVAKLQPIFLLVAHSAFPFETGNF